MSTDTPVTLQHLAERLNLSRAAVSLALRNQPGVSVAVRNLVQRTAHEMGYRTNPLVAHHMAHIRTGRLPRYRAAIAYVGFWHDVRPGTLNQLHRAGIKSRSEDLGYKLEEFEIRRPEMMTKLTRTLRERRIMGVILGPLAVPGALEGVAWDDLVSVTIGYSLRRPEIHRSCFDHFGGAGLLLKEITRRGYRRPGLVLPLDDAERVNHLTVARYLAWQRLECRTRPVPPLVAPTIAADVLSAWLRKHRPDVVISPRPEICSWLQEAGFSVPGKVGFATPCWLESEPHCSGVDQKPRAVGAAAVDLLITQLQNSEHGLPVEPKLTLVQGRWSEGMTLLKSVDPVAD